MDSDMSILATTSWWSFRSIVKENLQIFHETTRGGGVPPREMNLKKEHTHTHSTQQTHNKKNIKKKHTKSLKPCYLKDHPS